MITDINQLDPSKRYTYADYLTWQFQERVELIKGWLYKMSPAPARKHQDVSIRMSSKIFNFLEGKKCRVYSAPFDVRLLNKEQSTVDNEIYSVVQPDICVVCDMSKLDKKGCLGAPDWIIEIASKGNSRKELETKFRLYEENGVLEYWIVFMGDETIAVYDLKDEKYQYRKIYSEDEKIPVKTLEGLEIDLTEIFAE